MQQFAEQSLMRGVIAHRYSARPRVLLNRELRIVRANRSMRRSFGVRQDNLIGSRADDWINVDPTLLHRLRGKIRTGNLSWHATLWLRLAGLRVWVDSQTLRPLHSRRAGYLLVSLAGIEVAEPGHTASQRLQ